MNAIVRPIAVVLSLPALLVTVGLFLLVINAAMLGLVALMLPGFKIDGFWTAVGGVDHREPRELGRAPGSSARAAAWKSSARKINGDTPHFLAKGADLAHPVDRSRRMSRHARHFARRRLSSLFSPRRHALTT